MFDTKNTLNLPTERRKTFSIDLELHDLGDYALVIAKGERLDRWIATVYEEIAEYLRHHNFALIVFDVSQAVGTLGTLEQFLIGSSLAPIRGAGIRRVAIVTNHEKPDNFIELVAKNRGFQVKEFPDLNDAKDWASKNCNLPR